jgi:protein SCO1
MRRRSSIACRIALAALWGALASQPSPANDPDELGHKRPRGVELSALYGLETHAGDRLGREAVRGRPFIVAFGFTHCPNVCPTTLLDLSNHLAELGPKADKVKVLFVTVDPARDTAEHLKSYLASFDPRIVGLTGSEAEIAAAAHALEAFYQRVEGSSAGSYTFDHTLKVAFFDRYGLLAANIDLVRARHERIKQLLERLLAQ